MAFPLPLICIGGSPSSGTTLLADLMDSVPGVVCPPEMHLFCVEGAYGYDGRFRTRAVARKAMRNRGIYSAPSRFFNWKYRATGGVGKDRLLSAMGTASGLRGFVEWYARKHAAWRGMEPSSLAAFAEKTPLNVNWAEDFCEAFPATALGGPVAGPGLFVHVVRDGRAVAASLARRGYPLYEAAMIWLHQVDAGRRAAERFAHCVEVRYEDLLDDPYEITAGLVARVGLNVGASAVKAGMRANPFRASLPRVETWHVSQWAHGIQHPPHYSTQLTHRNIHWLEGAELLRVTDQGRPGLEPVARFREMLRHYRYEHISEPEPPDQADSSRTAACYAAYLAKSRNAQRQEGLLLLGPPSEVQPLHIDHRTIGPIAAAMPRRRDWRLMWEAWARDDLATIRRLATLIPTEQDGSWRRIDGKATV